MQKAELERSVEELLIWLKVLVQRWVISWRGEEVVSEIIPSLREGMGGAVWSSESWRECIQE